MWNSLRRRPPYGPRWCSVCGVRERMERLHRSKWQVHGSAFMRNGPNSASSAATALVSNSHLCHVPEDNEQLVKSGPSMFHVKRGGRIRALLHRTPCRLGVQVRGQRAGESGHGMEIGAQSSLRQLDYVPVDASRPTTWQSGDAMAPSVVTAVPARPRCRPNAVV